MSQAASDELLFASLAADNATTFYRALVSYLARALRLRMRLLDEVPWQERERRLTRGAAHLGVMCGLQYVGALERGEQPGVELLAAPIMCAQRYQARPVYFSDVVVRRDSVLGSFDDLRGARWAFNEPTSHSGYGILRYTLATRADSATFLSGIVESGAHQRSIAWVVDGVVDASAIDSTVLETELRLAPELASQVRVVTTLGPSPIPPLVASRALPAQVREACRQVLLGMHRDPSARAILELGAVARFTSVVDADYDPIRDMSRAAAASDFC